LDSERGAFGFSNEKSLVYCASVLKAGPVAELAAPDVSLIESYLVR